MGEKFIPVQGAKREAVVLSERLGPNEKVVAPVPLEVNSRVEPLATNMVAAIVNNDATAQKTCADEFNRIARSVNATKITSYEALNQDLEERAQRRDKARTPKGKEPTKIDIAAETGKKELMDAAVLAVQSLIDRYPQLAQEIAKGNYKAIDTVLERRGLGFMKGVGKEVSKSVITSPEVKRELEILERFQRPGSRIDEAALNDLDGRIREWYRRNPGDTNFIRGEEIALVQEYSYYARLRNDLLGGMGTGVATGGPAGGPGVDQNAAMWQALYAQGRAVAGGERGIIGGANTALEMQLLQEQMQLKSTDDAEVKRWASEVTDFVIKSYGEEMFSVSGGWQTLRNHLGTQIQHLVSLHPEEGEALRSRLERLVYPIATPRFYEAAIYGCDEAVDAYIQLLPPPENMPSALWDKTKREALIGKRDKNNRLVQKMENGRPVVDKAGNPVYVVPGDRVIVKTYDMIMGDAYNARGGGERIVQVVKALSSREAMDQYAENYAKFFMQPRNWETIKTEFGSEADGWKITEANKFRIQRELTRRARVAVSVFIVDEYPRWAGWLQSNAVREPPTRDQFMITTEKDGSHGWSRLTKFKDKNSFMRRTRRDANDVNQTYVQEVWSSKPSYSYTEIDDNGEVVTREGSTDVGHPLFGPFFDPEGLPTIKNALNHELRSPVVKAVNLLVRVKWRAKRYEDGPHKGEFMRDAEGKLEIGEMPRLSEINPKDIKRLGGMYSVIGGSNWDKLDDFSKVYDAMKDVASMFSDPNEKNKWAGAVIGNLLAGKIRVAMSRSGSEAFTQTLALIFQLGEMSKEQAMTASALFGSQQNADWGVIRDAALKANLNIFTPDFVDAMSMAATGARSPAEARRALAVQWAVIGNDMLDAARQAIDAISTGKKPGGGRR